MTSKLSKREGREGNRWYNQKPTGTELATWFSDSVPLHEGMSHEPYLGGVILIPNTEKSEEVVGFDANNKPIREDRHDLVYTPYVKVETRIAYFWDWIRRNSWAGAIEPSEIPPMGESLLHAPPGFFLFDVYRGTNPIRYIGYSVVIKVFERDERLRYEGGRIVDGTPILQVPGSRIQPLLNGANPDPNSLMKVETGAVGRALALAGVLVVPGSSVASAEDMIDARTSGSAVASRVPQGLPAPGVGQATPPPEIPQEPFADQATRLWNLVNDAALQDDVREKAREEFKEWARQQGVKTFSDSIADERIAKLATQKLERIADRYGIKTDAPF